MKLARLPVLAAAIAPSACGPALKLRPLTADPLHAYAAETRTRAAAGTSPSAGSLWSGRSTAPSTDFKARRVDDIVIIQVVETTRATTTTDTKTNREAKADAGISKLFGLESVIPGLKEIGASSKTDFKGSGTTARNTNLRAAVAARVTDVLGNGNLLVEAHRQLTINGETQGIRLVGIVRPADLDASGSVLSTQISDLQVLVDGKGVVSETEKPGWLHRLASYVLPF